MIGHAQACYPQEGCGLLVGRRMAERFIPMENTLGSSTAYEMDPKQLVDTLRALRESGEELVAIYHSHPSGPAEPSARDIAQAFHPEAAHIIVSLAEAKCPQVRGFRIIEGVATEIELHAIV